MTLPASGQIGFAAIATEMGISAANLSLRNFSLAAGLTVPDQITEFYGKTAILGNFSGPSITSDNATYKEGYYNFLRTYHVSPVIITLSFHYQLTNGSGGSNIAYSGTAGSGSINSVTGGQVSGDWTSPNIAYNQTLRITIIHNKPGLPPSYCQFTNLSFSIVSGGGIAGAMTPSGNVNFDKT
jgi:hypothetical protein